MLQAQLIDHALNEVRFLGHEILDLETGQVECRVLVFPAPAANRFENELILRVAGSGKMHSQAVFLLDINRFIGNQHDTLGRNINNMADHPAADAVIYPQVINEVVAVKGTLLHATLCAQGFTTCFFRHVASLSP